MTKQTPKADYRWKVIKLQLLLSKLALTVLFVKVTGHVLNYLCYSISTEKQNKAIKTDKVSVRQPELQTHNLHLRLCNFLHNYFYRYWWLAGSYRGYFGRKFPEEEASTWTVGQNPKSNFFSSRTVIKELVWKKVRYECENNCWPQLGRGSTGHPRKICTDAPLRVDRQWPQRCSDFDKREHLAQR